MRLLLTATFVFILFAILTPETEASETGWICGIYEGGEVRCLNRETENIYQVNPLFFIPSETRVSA